MMPVRKIVTISAISAAVILGSGYLVFRASAGPYIPQEFSQQRIAGAGAAKNVARLVSDSLGNLVKIEAYDKAGSTAKALDLVIFERNNKQEKQNAAALLAGNLQKMAESTKDITPPEARQVAVEAVSAGISMVSHLINYNAYLDSLFEALNAKFARQPYTGLSVTELISSINSEAQAINDANQSFNAALADFDRQFVK